MAIVPNPHGTTGFLGWIDDRFPLTKMWRDHVSEYYAPKNFNFWYFFGSLAMLVLANQLITGIFLTMHYKPSALEAFGSVEYIMRDVPWGWLIRYMHSTGASAFFVVVYLHMFRGLLYGSYRKPRELVWIFGMMIFLALMAEAFMGYVLPWGNMSYWGAQVIISLFGAIPGIGPDLVQWIRGDYLISDATLNRFFALHVIAVPLVLVGLVVAHLMALHEVGSNNPDGVDIKKNKDENGIPKDGIPFHPYYTVKDIMGVVGFAMIFCAVLFFAPEMGGYFLEKPNFTPANPLVTPPHIAPVWYFTPFYSVLRAITYPLFGIDAKFWGVIGMGASVVIIAFLPWLDRSPVKSIRYKGPIFKIALAVFVVAFVILGIMGFKPATPTNTMIAQVCSVIYFGFFLLMPWYTKIDKTKPVPERVTMDH
jgi:ubiquinol-cytochrome c reductase cytochrome b subunit